MITTKQAEIVRSWTEKHPQAAKARQMIGNAIKRGFIIKPKNCEVCGRETKIYGHHHDYNKPFEVKWVCGSCHKKIHVKPKRETKDINYISITCAARIKGVSRSAVTQAVVYGKIFQEMIKDVPHILQNRAFENWKPGVKK